MEKNEESRPPLFFNFRGSTFFTFFKNPLKVPQNGNFFKKCPLLAFAFTKCWPSYESGPILKISTDLGFFYRKTTQKKEQGDLKVTNI